jgi:hypothetical protein
MRGQHPEGLAYLTGKSITALDVMPRGFPPREKQMQRG